MKKNLIWIIGIIGLFFLSWCTKLQETKILFDKYTFTLKTTNTYQETTNIQSETSLLKTYIQQQSWFSSSLLIAKQEILSWTDIDTIIAKNIQHELKSISNANLEKEKEIDISCWDEDISGQSKTLEIETNNGILYLTQYYFIDQWFLFTLSSLTPDKKQNKEILSSLKTLSCLR